MTETVSPDPRAEQTDDPGEIDRQAVGSGLHLVIQIPCLNEAETLPATLAELPRSLPGVATIEVLVIDDGSTDGTAEVALANGVAHVVRNTHNLGLARSFSRGLDVALKRGADVIVNTDGDNQYAGEDIVRLLQPILSGEADIVIGDRQTDRLAHFSGVKKVLQKLGSAVVRQLSGTEVPDAVSGFRALSREAALRLNILTPYSYTVEMVIQAGKKNMAIRSVPVQARPVDRPSRLFGSLPSFVGRQLSSMVRMYGMYESLRVFFALGAVFCLVGAVPIARWLVFYFSGDGDGHLQSLVLGTGLLVMGFFCFLGGLLADLVAHNRQLAEITLEKVRRLELNRTRPGDE